MFVISVKCLRWWLCAGFTTTDVSTIKLENSSRKVNKKEEIAYAFVCCLVVVTSIQNKVLVQGKRNKSNKCAHTQTCIHTHTQLKFMA